MVELNYYSSIDKRGGFMIGCKHEKYDVVNGIAHRLCSNGEQKKNKKSQGNVIPCMGKLCGYFEELEKKEKN